MTALLVGRTGSHDQASAGRKGRDGRTLSPDHDAGKENQRWDSHCAGQCRH